MIDFQLALLIEGFKFFTQPHKRNITLTVKKELIKQLNLTITAVKTINQKNPTPMVKNILKRYEETKGFIQRSPMNNSKKASLKLNINLTL